MQLNESFPVSPQKIEELKKRILALGIRLDEVEEQFIRGSGHGGQKINKTSNTVHLKYPPHQLIVKVGASRERSLNRFLALRELVDKIEMKISPNTSKRIKEWEKIHKQKLRRARKFNKKELLNVVKESSVEIPQ